MLCNYNWKEKQHILMNFVREYKKEMVICNKMKLLVGQKVILQIFFQWVNITCYHSMYTELSIKLMVSSLKKKAQKTTTTKTKMAKTDKFRTMYRYYTLQNTQHIHTTLQKVRRSKNDRTTQQLQEHSNFQWDNTTNDHISKVK